MRFFTVSFIPALLAAMLLVSCGDTGDPNPERTGLAGFVVEFSDDFDLGSEEDRTPASREIVDGNIIAKINVTAIGYDKKRLEDYNGTVSIGLRYGINRGVARTELKNGLLSNHEVKMTDCLDKDRVVVQEVIKTDDSSQPVPTGKLGVSPEFYAEAASIVAIQSTIDKGKGSPSRFDKRNLTISGHPMVVTAVIEGGFYVTQVDAKEYASIYLYSHSTPFVEDDSDVVTLPVGTLVESANGSVSEFFGYTEMSFPTYTPVYETDEETGKKKIKVDVNLIPDAVDITSFISDDSKMEKYEASIVTIKNVTVSDFNENDSAYTEYSQFPLATKYGKVLAQTIYTAPSFDPVKEKSTDHRFDFTGILKQHTSARPTWIIVPRDHNDIKCLNCEQQ